jgi:GAF domain-containing protein/ActR/RegA family two-component response regulator
VDFIWDSIARHLIRLVGAKRSLFLLVDTKAKRLVKATGYGYPPEHLQQITIDEVEAGVSGWVLQNKTAVLIENAQSDPRNTGVALERAKDFSTTPLIVAPLVIQDEAIGTLTVANSEGDPAFDEDDRELVVMLAAQASIAYDTARRMQELELLHKAAEAVAAPLEAPQVLRQIVESACDVLQADSSALWSYDDTLNQFRPDELVAHRISRDELEKFRKKGPKKGGTADTVMARGWVGISDISDSQMDFAGSSTIALLNSVGVRSFQGVSLTVGNERLGVLYVNYNQPQHFTLREKRVLKTLASHAALALKKVRLLDELGAALEQVTRARNTAQVVAEVTTLEELQSTLDSIVKGTKDTLGCDVVTLYTYNQERDEFDFPPTMVGVRHKKKVLGFGFVSRDSVPYKIIKMDEPYVTQQNAPDIIIGSPFSLREGIKSAIGVPLRVAGQKVGVMFVNYRTAHVVTKEDLTNVKLFAQQAAIAIENARLYDAAKQRAEKLGAVLNISKTAISSLDLDHILNAACRAVVDLLQVDHSGLVLFDKNHVTGKVCAEYPELGTIGVEFPVQGVPAEEKLVASKQPLMVPDVANETGFDPVRDVLTRLGTCSILLVPILSGGDLLGSFGLDMMQRQRTFTREEIEICTIFAAQVAVAIEKARQYEQLKQSRETIAAMTAVAWMGIVSGTWRHNLGNNVTIIEDLVKLIRKDLSRRGSPEKIKDRLKEIEEITGDLQDLPMYPLSAEEDVESVPINQLLEDRIRQLEKKERYKEIHFSYRFEIEHAASVRASPEWLRRVIDILIDNAANAMEEAKDKKILFVTRQVNNGVEIALTDSGKGIPESIRSRLFQETFRKKKGEKGSGIGLFLARIIIQTYHGALTLGSTGPQGTTMVIWLPLENNEAVLLVRNEDNQHWEDIIEESLSPGRSLQRCTEGEILEKLRNRHFALIIVDAEAVDDAPRLVSAIKAKDKKARIVVATASPTWKPAREVLKAGAVDFIRKLSDPGAIRLRLEQALQKPLKRPDSEG